MKRREFLTQLTLAAGGAALPGLSLAQSETSPKISSFNVAGYDYDRIRAIKDSRVGINGESVSRLRTSTAPLSMHLARIGSMRSPKLGSFPHSSGNTRMRDFKHTSLFPSSSQERFGIAMSSCILILELRNPKIFADAGLALRDSHSAPVCGFEDSFWTNMASMQMKCSGLRPLRVPMGAG